MPRERDGAPAGIARQEQLSQPLEKPHQASTGMISVASWSPLPALCQLSLERTRSPKNVLPPWDRGRASLPYPRFMAASLLRGRAQEPVCKGGRWAAAAAATDVRTAPWAALALMCVCRLLPPHNERRADRSAAALILSPMSSALTYRVELPAYEALWEL